MAGSSFFYCGGTIFRRTVVDFKLYSNACHPPHFNDQREPTAARTTRDRTSHRDVQRRLLLQFLHRRNKSRLPPLKTNECVE